MAFLTNFNLIELPIYQRAVNTWVNRKDFAVSKRTVDKNPNGGSLHYFGSENDLSPFWFHFDNIKEEMRLKT